MDKETCYYNYRCRKCGGIIAIKTIKPNYYTQDGGLLLSSNYHKCPAGIADGEKVLCDRISISDNLLEDAVDVIIPSGLREDNDNDDE